MCSNLTILFSSSTTIQNGSKTVTSRIWLFRSRPTSFQSRRPRCCPLNDNAAHVVCCVRFWHSPFGSLFILMLPWAPARRRLKWEAAAGWAKGLTAPNSPNWRERGQCLESDSNKVRRLAGVGEEEQGGIMGNVPTDSPTTTLTPKLRKKRQKNHSICCVNILKYVH